MAKSDTDNHQSNEQDSRLKNFFSYIKAKKFLFASISVILILVASSFFFFGQKSQSNDPYGMQSSSPQKLEASESTLLIEAKKENIEVTNEQVEDFIQDGLEKNKISEEDFNQRLQESGMTKEQFKEDLQKQLIISELIKENVDLKSVEVSDKEVDDYLESHETEFADFLEDEEDSQALKSRVMMVLLRNKQTELISEYVDSLN